MNLNLPALAEVLDEVEFFERERTDRQVVELAILLYGCGVSLRRISQVLGWLGVEHSHVAVWTYPEVRPAIGPGGSATRPADLPAVCLHDETAISQHGEEFTLFAAVDPDTHHLLHAEVAPTRTYLTTERFFDHHRALYGRLPPIVVTDGADDGPVFTHLGITRINRQHSVRNRIERWLQELKRRIDTFYASFTEHDVATTNNWLRQFAWV